MPSINDVLKEKFNVTGNNIAETLSKIEPGSGGGGFLVNIREVKNETDKITYTLDKNFFEIFNALPNVMFVQNSTMDEDPTSHLALSVRPFKGMQNEDGYYVDVEFSMNGTTKTVSFSAQEADGTLTGNFYK